MEICQIPDKGLFQYYWKKQCPRSQAEVNILCYIRFLIHTQFLADTTFKSLVQYISAFYVTALSNFLGLKLLYREHATYWVLGISVLG